jgi:hypothetical protein
MRKWLALACIGVLLAIAAFAWLRATNGGKEAEMPEVPLPETCREAAFDGIGYVICAVDPRSHAIGLHLKAADGRPYGSLAELARAQPFLFAMNAGMYHHDLSPVGLYVESGIEGAPLNLDNGAGNFFMKPNGVFFVDREGRAAVTESAAFAAARPDSGTLVCSARACNSPPSLPSSRCIDHLVLLHAASCLGSFRLRLRQRGRAMVAVAPRDRALSPGKVRNAVLDQALDVARVHRHGRIPVSFHEGGNHDSCAAFRSATDMARASPSFKDWPPVVPIQTSEDAGGFGRVLQPVEVSRG